MEYGVPVILWELCLWYALVVQAIINLFSDHVKNEKLPFIKIFFWITLYDHNRPVKVHNDLHMHISYVSHLSTIVQFYSFIEPRYPFWYMCAKSFRYNYVYRHTKDNNDWYVSSIFKHKNCHQCIMVKIFWKETV